MANYNKIILIGHTGGDAEMKFTAQGTAVTNFSLAVSRSYKKGDEWVKETDWFRIIAWGKLAETCNQHVAKGDNVMVEGQLQIKKWSGEDGITKTTVEVKADKVVFLKNKQQSSEQPQGYPEATLEPDEISF